MQGHGATAAAGQVGAKYVVGLVGGDLTIPLIVEKVLKNLLHCGVLKQNIQEIGIFVLQIVDELMKAVQRRYGAGRLARTFFVDAPDQLERCVHRFPSINLLELAIALALESLDTLRDVWRHDPNGGRTEVHC